MKKFLSEPRNAVTESLEGLALAHPSLLEVRGDPPIVVRRGGATNGRVGLVSGGGSGHEPMHTGLVGFGMLTAAVPGAVFTSPTPDPIVAATVASNGGAGVLHIVKNYTGDVLNFETAAELAEAEGVEVRSVLVDDDVAVTDSLYTAGRRGVAGTVLVEKIAGAAAEAGASLDEVERVANDVIASVRSMGVALRAPVVPTSGEESFTLTDGEIEIGIGIHGEPGRRRIKHAPVRELVEDLLNPIVEDLPYSQGDEVLLFVNGMGGTPLAELYTVFGVAASMLDGKGIRVTRSLVGDYSTSLDMQGASITLLRLDGRLTELWDAPVETASLRWGR